MAEIWKDKYVDPREIQKEQERFILCFSFYDVKHLLDIKPNGGIYIYSSSEAFGEEQEFDFLRLKRWLELFRFTVYGFRVEGGDVHFEKGFHASGHASKKDLREIVEKIDPDVLIPVHTENAEWFTENFENVKVMDNGDSLMI